MVWNPTLNVIDTSVIDANLITFIKANQVDALTWANGGTALKSFKTISDSVADRTKPIFPRLSIVDSTEGTTSSGDLNDTAYQVTFECVFESLTVATVTSTAKKYDTALKSMLANISASAITSGMLGVTSARFISIESGFEELASNKQQNDFFSEWQVRVTYALAGSAYNS